MRPTWTRLARRLPFCLLAGVLASGGSAVGADVESLTLIRLGTRGPCFIGLDISIDRAPVGDSRNQQLTRLFRLLDEDANGELSEHELQELVLRGEPSFKAPANQGWWKEADLSDPKGVLDLAEFRQLESSILGPQILLQFLPERQSQLFDLPLRLDLNRDGRISFQEIRVGSETLGKYDLNEDGSIAVEELVPMGVSPSPDSVKSEGSQMWMMISAMNRHRAGEQILRLYDRLPEEKVDGRVGAKELNLKPDQFSGSDANQDGGLDLQELELFLESPPLELKARVEIRTSSLRKPKLNIESFSTDVSVKTQEKATVVTIDGSQVDFTSRGTMITSDDARRFYRSNFLQADLDKNQYLSEQEFSGLRIPGARFAVVDRDRNNMLYDKELLSYLQLQILLTEGRITFSCSNETRSLLESLDRDLDHRLSVREFLEGEVNLKNLDRDTDGAISPYELSHRQGISIEYNRSPLLEFAARSATQQIVRSQTLQSLSGPIWFQRMDRNLDGTITRREFLGPLDLFEKLDHNQDGVIDEHEAVSAQ